MIAPGERVELRLDFSGDKVGTERVLRSLEFDGGSAGMMGMMRSRGFANGTAFDVLKVQVERTGPKIGELPSKLSSIPWPRLEDAANRNTSRTIELQMGMMQLGLNGRAFEIQAVARNEIVKLGSTEVWEFNNEAGPMAHPMHVHNLQFKVIGRVQDPHVASVHDTMRAGLVDEGWNDIVIVMLGERVRVLLRFLDHTGLYLYHCHILEHEDMGMMRNYQVT